MGIQLDISLTYEFKLRDNMSNAIGNYCAFYVSEPFNESALGAHATKDLVIRAFRNYGILGDTHGYYTLYGF